MVDFRAVNFEICTIENIVDVVYQSNRTGPIPYLFCPINICLVSRHSCQSSSELEKTTIGDRIFIVMTGVLRGKMPAKTTTTRVRVKIPALHVIIEGIVTDLQPGRIWSRWLGETIFCRRHGS